MRLTIPAFVFLACVCLVKSGCHLKWTVRVQDYGINDRNHKTIYHTTEEACQRACEQETRFMCVSIDFQRRRKYCYLSKHGQNDVDVGDFTDWPNFNYLERTEDCCWTYREVGMGFDGYNEKVILQAEFTEEMCARACTSETEFECVAISYNVQDKKCIMSLNNRAEVGEYYVRKPGVVYRERTLPCGDGAGVDECASNPCLNGGTCVDKVNGFVCLCPAGIHEPRCALGCWTHHSISRGINRHNDKVITNMASEEACKEACVSETDFECASIDFKPSNNNCFLSTANRETAGDDYVPKLDMIYRERTLPCDDIDQCSSDPCQNGGTCNDVINGFTCDCVDGYQGDNCESTTIV